MTTTKNDKIQVIKCKCGKIFAACAEPDCYTDKDWQKNLSRYVKGGCSVSVLNGGEFTFEKCDCAKEETQKNPTLFDLLSKS